uniref:Type II secretion system protein GspE N-terminal domain-containing protein n=1 Tax=candidate division WOR-3 bacterium TaxID=2052148 RepID=A0A7V0Z6U3_UNCW3
MRIGELLVKSGIITEEQLNEALKIQEKNKKKIGEILIELGYLKSRDLIWLLSEQVSVPFIELKPEIFDSKLILSFPEKLLYNYCIIPLYEMEDKLYIATGNPTETEGIEKIKEFTKKQIVVSAAEPAKIIQLLDKFFLAEQSEKIISEAHLINEVNINISKDGAHIEFIDEHGDIKNYKVNGNITIKYIKPEKE